MSEFKDITVLIVDPTGHSKALLKSILTNLHVKHVAAVPGTDEALQILRTELFSIVFCDELAGPLEPIEFLKTLRRDVTTRDVTVPVILVSMGSDGPKIMAARDAGMNDVIVKPVSSGTIERKLQSLLMTPKPFVTAREFVGPDRRRAGDERRQFGERPPTEDRRGSSSEGKVFPVSPRVGPDKPKKS